jgi:hypothetical protein
MFPTDRIIVSSGGSTDTELLLQKPWHAEGHVRLEFGDSDYQRADSLWVRDGSTLYEIQSSLGPHPLLLVVRSRAGILFALSTTIHVVPPSGDLVSINTLLPVLDVVTNSAQDLLVISAEMTLYTFELSSLRLLRELEFPEVVVRFSIGEASQVEVELWDGSQSTWFIPA